jgi:hypothetical protein
VAIAALRGPVAGGAGVPRQRVHLLDPGTDAGTPPRRLNPGEGVGHVVRVAVAHLDHLRRGRELLCGVLAHQLQHGEVRQAARAGYAPDQALVDKGPQCRCHVGPAAVARADVDVRAVPMYVYKSLDAFVDAMTGYVRRALREDLSRWEVTDCVVTMFDCGGSTSRSRPVPPARC